MVPPVSCLYHRCSVINSTLTKYDCTNLHLKIKRRHIQIIVELFTARIANVQTYLMYLCSTVVVCHRLHRNQRVRLVHLRWKTKLINLKNILWMKWNKPNQIDNLRHNIQRLCASPERTLHRRCPIDFQYPVQSMGEPDQVLNYVNKNDCVKIPHDRIFSWKEEKKKHQK